MTLPETILVAPVKRCPGSRNPAAPGKTMSIGVQPMFSRKRSETEDRKMADSHDDPRISMTSPRAARAAATAPVRPPAMPPPTPELARAAGPLRPADSLLGRPSELSDQSKPDGQMRRLSVGRGITLS